MQLNRHFAPAALAAGHGALSLWICPDWIFAKYPNLVAALAKGELGSAQAADASPLYLLLNWWCSPAALRISQALIAAASVYGAFVVTERAAGRSAAWPAAAALALAQPWLSYSAVLEPDLLIGALGLLAVAMLALGAPERVRWSALAGAALGLSCGLRPSAAPFAIAALGWLAFDRRRERPVRHAATFSAALVACAVLPAALLQARAHHEWRATMSAGQVFHQGHRPESAGLGASYPFLLKMIEAHGALRADHQPDAAHELYRRFAAATAAQRMTPVEAESFWIDRAKAYFRLHPAAFVLQLFRKWVFTVAAPGIDADIPDLVGHVQSLRVPWLPLRWIAVAGAAGLLLCFRRGRIPALLALWVLAYQVAYVAFYYQARYSLAIVPAWCCLLGCAGAAIREAARERSRLAARLAIAAVPLALLLVPFVREQARVQQRFLMLPVRSAAAELRARGQLDAAQARFIDEQADFPDYVFPWSFHGYGLDAGSQELALRAAERSREKYGDSSPADAYLLAVLYARGGRCELALPLALRSAAAGFHASLDDLSLDPDLLAADCLLELGRPREALDHIRRSLDRWPGTLDGLSRALAAAGSGADLAEARAAWLAELFELHDAVSACYARGRERRRWGDPAGALQDADWILLHLPEAAPFAQFERGLSLLDLGRTTDALRAYAQTLSLRNVLHGTERFDAAVRELSAARGPGTLQIAVSHWIRRGHRVELRSLLKRHPELGRAEAPIYQQ